MSGTLVDEVAARLEGGAGALPAVAAPAALRDVAAVLAGGLAAARPPSPPAVLVCADDPLVAGGLARLAERGLATRAEVAGSIEEAERELRRRPPDLLVCEDRLGGGRCTRSFGRCGAPVPVRRSWWSCRVRRTRACARRCWPARRATWRGARRRAGCPRRFTPCACGVIVNVSSLAGHVGLAGRATDLLARAMAAGGFTREELAGRTPLGRLAEPEEVARVVAFVASDEASYLTGSSVLVDGGWVGDRG